MESYVTGLLHEMPVVGILVVACWYYRRDMLARIGVLERQIEEFHKSMWKE